jgi:hypothetical protein
MDLAITRECRRLPRRENDVLYTFSLVAYHCCPWLRLRSRTASAILHAGKCSECRFQGERGVEKFGVQLELRDACARVVLMHWDALSRRVH